MLCCLLVAPGRAAVVQLQMAPSPNAPVLSASPVAETGALFIYQASDLSSLSQAPTLFFQTNTPCGLSLPAGPVGGASTQAFFFAVHWPGRSVDQFGSPEYAPDSPPPGMLLVLSGLPASLTPGQAYTIDYFVTDPTGQLLALSGPVQLLVVRQTDGALHPDAQVTPASQTLIGGHLRAQITVQSQTSLNGYTLGLGPVTCGGTTLGVLPAALNLGPTPLPSPTAAALLQTLENNRSAATDPDPSWSCPLATTGQWEVAGTFGEWRGTLNQEVHAGLDLAAPANAPVLAARGGVVSSVGTLPGLAGSVVLDHGDGWFSRHAGLEAGSVVVTPGQTVLRGATLATGLAAPTGGPVHLHFELRRGNGQAQWGVAAPGSSQDPLQTPGIFAVPAGNGTPTLEAVGLTSLHPGQQPFAKLPPNTLGPGGGVYLFARLVEVEPGNPGQPYRLGLRSMSFRADGMSAPAVIQPASDVAVQALRPPGTGAALGFAQYGVLHAAHPDSFNWYAYWWAWNTAAYATNPIGPRTVLLTTQSYSGATVTNSLSFGPEILNNVWQPLGGNAYKITLVAHLGSANLGLQTAQPDQYQLEVLHTNRTPIPGVQWDGTLPGNCTRVFSNHLERADYTFHLPAGESATNLVVRVSSRLDPDLRHEVSQGVVQMLGRATNAPALVDLPAGTFVMGSPVSEIGRADAEGPQTTVTLTYAFKMSQYPVTQAQYKSVMGNNPSYFSGVSTRPVEQVSWSDATNYCAQLTRLEQQAGYLPAGWAYRLPTEAEWEYACRAGTTSAFAFGPALRSGRANFNGHYEYDAALGTVLNTTGSFAGTPVPVGNYAPNAWGLYDLHGNVWEWCLDGWRPNLPGGNATNPRGPALGSDGVLRGGGWYNDGQFCRSAFRLRSAATYRGNDTGFRLVLAPLQP